MGRQKNRMRQNVPELTNERDEKVKIYNAELSYIDKMAGIGVKQLRKFIINTMIILIHEVF